MCTGRTLQLPIIIVTKIEDELLDFISENRICLQIPNSYFPQTLKPNVSQFVSVEFIQFIIIKASLVSQLCRMRFRTSSYHPYLATHGYKQIVCISRVFHY